MSVLAALPKKRPPLSDLPIPQDVAVDETWCWTLHEMADHMGAFAVLQLVDQIGGLQLYIPKSADGWFVSDIIGRAAADILAHIYIGEKLDLPVGRTELFGARAGPLIAAIRADQMTYTEAAFALHTSRKHIWHLVKRTPRAWGVKPRLRQSADDLAQLSLFPLAPEKDAA
jgi:hypothetical protein